MHAFETIFPVIAGQIRAFEKAEKSGYDKKQTQARFKEHSALCGSDQSFNVCCYTKKLQRLSQCRK